MDKSQTTLVFGASLKEQRYSNRAMRALRTHGYNCIGMGLRAGTVGDVPVLTFDEEVKDIHTVTMYMNATRQAAYIPQILGYQPKRIIFNPGAENPVLYEMAQQQGIEVENACTLVLLSLGAY